MLLGVSKDRNTFISGLEGKGVTILRNIGDQSTKCNFSEELENLKSPNLKVNKMSQIYVSIQV
jgi:hypothetical protein